MRYGDVLWPSIIGDPRPLVVWRAGCQWLLRDEAVCKFDLPTGRCRSSKLRGPNRINTRILHSGSKAQAKGESETMVCRIPFLRGLCGGTLEASQSLRRLRSWVRPDMGEGFESGQVITNSNEVTVKFLFLLGIYNKRPLFRIWNCCNLPGICFSSASKALLTLRSFQAITELRICHG